MGHPVVMGRKTFQSLARPLAGRRNIVLTRDPALVIPGCAVAHSRDQVLAVAGDDELFVIGGAEVYGLFLPLAQRLYLTRVEGSFPGDTRFPEVRWDDWRVLREETGSSLPGVPPHRFVDYERVEALRDGR